MNGFISAIRQSFYVIGSIRVRDVVDILLVTVLIYVLLRLIRRTHSSKVFQGIFILLIILWISDELRLHTINFILRNTMQIGLLALVVLFQPEIRRFLERLGAGTPVTRLFRTGDMEYAESAITQTVMACTDMSAAKIGALIIFERDNNLDDQIRTGTIVNADITAELLKNIFYPKAPLHDGAAIIRNGRIEAAGCMLPLTNNTNLSKDLGMRHRAGIGMSEGSDAVVVIVSEETGAISIATGGMLKRHLSKETFEKILRNELIHEEEDSGRRRFFHRERRNENE